MHITDEPKPTFSKKICLKTMQSTTAIKGDLHCEENSAKSKNLLLRTKLL
jgi:hypothetical protein